MTSSSPGSRGRAVVGLLAGTIATLTLLTLIMFVSQRPTTGAPASAPKPTGCSQAPTTPSPSSQGAGEDDHDAASDEKASWEPVVLGFAKNFATTSEETGLSSKQWRAGLAPYVTAAVADQLAEVDLAKVPRGHYAGYEVLTPGSYQIAVKVTYREAWALVLYLISDGKQWRISAYDRWED